MCAEERKNEDSKECADCDVHKAWITHDIKTIWEKYRDSIPQALVSRIKDEYDWLVEAGLESGKEK